MTEPEIYEELTVLFRQLFGNETLVLRPGTTARQVRGWDSAKMISILMSIEEGFGFEIRSREIDRLKSISDIVALIKLRQDETRAGCPLADALAPQIDGP